MTTRRTVPPTVVLAVASLGVFMAFVDATIVNIAFPDMERSFPEAGISGLSWVLNAYNIVFAAFLVAAGRIADLLGRKHAFQIGLVLFTLASALCAVAPSAGFLVGARVVQALGAAIVVPASLALVLAAFSPERHAHAVALWTASAALASGVGPPLGGLLVSADSWRLVFVVNLPIGATAYVLARRKLIESRVPGRRRLPDLAGALTLAVAVASLTLAIVEGNEWGWASPRIVVAFALAAALSVVFARRCTRHPAPLVDVDLVRVRTFSVANGITILAAAGFFGYTLANVLFLTSVWHYSVLEAGLALMPGPLIATVIAGPGSHVAERAGARIVLIAGGAFWAAGMLYMVTRVGVHPAFVREWLPGIALLGVGAGLTFPNMSAAAVASAPGDRFATATALNSVARQVGAALGVAVMVAVFGAPAPADAPTAFDQVWTVSAGFFGGVILLALTLGKVRGAEPALPSLATSARTVASERPPSRPAPVVPPPAQRPRAARRPVTAHESAADFLSQVSIFAPLSEEMRARIAAGATALRLHSGDWLFRRGDPGDSLYVVRAGRLEVVDDGDEATVVGLVGRGDVVGELALLTGGTRAVSVRAARDTDLLKIGGEHFEHLLHDAPELPLALTRVLGSYLQASRPVAPRVRPVPVTVAIVAHGVAPGAIAEALHDRLLTWGRVALLSGDEAGPWESEDELLAKYGPFLDRCEHEYAQILLVARDAREEGRWTDLCLKQADRIVLVTTGSELPRWLLRRAVSFQGCDLVGYGVQPGSGLLTGWVDALSPATSWVLPKGAELTTGMDRLARRLTGRAVGVALSGGGARALAHIGVLDELDRAGIEIDRVGGVSMGAVIGSLWAIGRTPDEIDAILYDELVRRNPLNDYTVPRISLIRGEKVKAVMRRLVGTVAIEELERGFLCTTADLRSGQLVVHRSGPLWEHVSTSFSIPVIAPPRVEGRRLLVDGGVVNNLPVAPLAATGEGPVIAVAVRMTGDETRPRGNGAAHDGQRSVRPPRLGETLMRTMVLASANMDKEARAYSQLVVETRAPAIGLFEFHQIDQAIEAGRRAAREALEAAGSLSPV